MYYGANPVNDNVPHSVVRLFHSKKLPQLDVHPTMPLLVCADKKGEIVLYNYSSDSEGIIRTVTVNEMYEKHREAIHLVKMLEKNDDYVGERLVEPPRVDPKAAVEIKSIRFYDADVVYWKLVELKESSEANAANKRLASVSPINFDKNEPKYSPYDQVRFLVMQTEHRVAFINYNSSESNLIEFHEVKQTALENKAIACFEFLYTAPWIAIGGADGVIRFYNFMENAVIEKKKITAHAKPVTKLITIGRKGDTTSTYPHLVSCGQDGSIICWDIAKETAVFTIARAHEAKAVNDIWYDSKLDIIFSVGEDKTIAVWDAATGAEKHRYKMTLKLGPRSIGLYDINSSPGEWFVVSASNTKLYRIAAQLDASTWDEELDLVKYAEGLQLNSAAKIYSVQIHPLHKNIIFCGTNFGLFIIDMNQRYKNTVAVAYANRKETREIAQQMREAAPPTPVFDPMKGFGFSPVSSPTAPPPMPSPGSLTARSSIQLTPSSPHADGSALVGYDRYVFYVKDGTLIRRAVLDSNGRQTLANKEEAIKQLHRKTNVSLSVSKTGRYLAILYPDACEYEVHSTDTYKVVCSGQSVLKLVWSADADRFALLKVEKNKKKVAIMEIKNNSPAPVVNNVDTMASVGDIFGGLLLGLSYEGDASATLGFNFIAWDGLASKGGTLPRVNHLLWDKLFHHCLLVFDDSFAIFTYRPQFKMRCYVKGKIVGALWFQGSLFIYTGAEIKLVTNFEDRYEYITVATFEVAKYVGIINRANVEAYSLKRLSSTLDPLPSRMPKGPIELVDVVEDNLIVMDIDKNFHSIPLSHPVIRFKMLVNAGMISEAIEWMPHVDVQLHEREAVFLASKGHAHFVITSDLFVLSAEAKYHLCIDNGLPAQAYDAVVQIQERHEQIASSRDADSIESTALMLTENQKIGEYFITVAMALLEQANYNEDPAVVASYNNTAMQALIRASKLHKDGYKHLVVFYGVNNMTEQLWNLKDELAEKQLYEELSLANVYLNDNNAVDDSLRQYDKGTLAMRLSKTEPRSIPAIIAEWKESIANKYPTLPSVTFGTKL